MNLLKHSGTGLPFLALTVLVFLFVFTLESYLSEAAGKTEVVRIDANSDDRPAFEQFSSSVNFDESSHVSSLLGEVVDEQTDDIEAWLEQNLPRLSSIQKVELLFRAGRHFYEKRKYAHVVVFLGRLTLDERILLDVQLSYAFALAKTSSVEESIEQYRQLVSRKPNSQAAHLNLGLLLAKNHRCDQAVPVFAKTVEISSGRKKAKAFAGLGDCYLDGENYRAAVQHYLKATEYRPDHPGTWLSLAGASAKARGRYGEVLDLFDKAISLRSGDHKYHLRKARYQLANFDYPGAESTLYQAAKHSNRPVVRELLVWAFLEQGKRNKARKQLREIEKLSSSGKRKQRLEYLAMYVNKDYEKLIASLDGQRKLTRSMKYLRALTNRKLGYFKSASAILGQLDDTGDYANRARIELARIARSRRQYESAIRQYENLLEHNDRAAFLWFESALAAERLGRPGLGKQKIGRAIELDSDNHVYQLAGARLERLDGRTDAAIEIVEEIIGRRPNSARALKLLAELLLENNEIDRLIATYRRILEVDADNYEVMFELASLYVSGGDHLEAKALLDRLTREKSDHIDARFLYARTLYLDSSFEQSLAELEKLLRLDTSHRQSLDLRRTILSRLDRQVK